MRLSFTNLTRLQVDSQVLEGPNIGEIRCLLNILLVDVAQVLEAPNIGNIRDLLNLLDVTSLGLTPRHLRAPISAILGAYSTFCWSNTARHPVARVSVASCCTNYVRRPDSCGVEL